MGLREKLNENPKIAMGVAIGVVVLALVVLVFTLMPGGPDTSSTQYQGFYSEDDGKTTFVDVADKAVPFKGPNGKDAVMAHVFKDNNGNQIIGYLEKTVNNERQVKKPGKAWVKANSEEGMKVTRVTDAAGNTLVEIPPGTN